MDFEMSKGHAWQIAVLVAPVVDGPQSHVRLLPSAFVPLGFVLQALTEGVATHSPRWLTSEAELVAELNRLGRRLDDHGADIFAGAVDWEVARRIAHTAIARAALAAAGSSQKARELEAAELALGRDELAEARRRYEIMREFGPVERRRLEALRRGSRQGEEEHREG
jgi:hypothetical protein